MRPIRPQLKSTPVSAAGAVFFAILTGASFRSIDLASARPRAFPHSVSSPAPGRKRGARHRPAAAAISTVAATEWYGVTFGGERIGYASVVSSPVHWNGRPAVRVESQTFMRLKLLGNEMSEDVDETDFFSPSGSPLKTDFLTRSGGHQNHVVVVYSPHAVSYTVEGSEAVVLPIPPKVTLGSSNDFSVNPALLHPGAHWSEYYFDPATLAIERFSGTVIGKADQPGVGPLWNVEGSTVMGAIRMSVAPDGVLVRAEMPLGIEMNREPREVARMDADYHPTADLAEVGAVKTSTPIENPRRVSRLELIVSGLPPGVRIPSGPGQSVTPAGAGAWRVDTSRIPFPPAAAPIPEAAPRAALTSTLEIDASNPEIVSMAKSIVAGATDSAHAVALIHDWVNVHMRARYDIGVIRCGLDVLHDQSGVCRDYAVLYASLARAAGIPTWICSGLVYWQGKFYYHAWDESFIGKWVRVDSTMAQHDVDATHITLARGDARSMYGAAGVVGQISIEVRSSAF